MHTVQSYIREQGTAGAVINAVLNPAISWLGNRRMTFVPLTGDQGMIVDTIATAIVLSLLVSLFVTPAARREFDAGRLTGGNIGSFESAVLAHWPSKAWSFGLLTGVVAAVVLAPLMYALISLLGSGGLSFAAFVILKAAYTAALGFAVTRWAILRQMLRHRANPADTG